MSRNVAYDSHLLQLEKRISAPGRLTGFGDIEPESIASRAKYITKRMLATYESKDTDYSENDLPMGNFRESVEWGIEPWRAVMIRLGDKKRRIGSFVKRASYLVRDESVDDTLIDFANYCLLGLVLFEEAVSKYRATDDQLLGLNCIGMFYSMAEEAIRSKLLYEYTGRPQIISWSEDPWEKLCSTYNDLAEWSRRYSNI